MGRLRLARAGWMGRWWQVVGVEGKKEGGELSLKKVCFSMAAQLVAGTEGRTGRKLKEPVGELNRSGVAGYGY